MAKISNIEKKNIKKKIRTKIAFLDRDGVLNYNKINNGYIGSIDQFKWISGAKKAIKFLKNLDYKVVVISNQSGIARNYFKIRDVQKIHKFMNLELSKIETKIDNFYFCPFHPKGVNEKYKKNSFMRKPEIGMFKEVEKKWKVDKQNSFMIGDSKTDMQFARNAKIRGFLFNSKNLLFFLKNLHEKKFRKKQV